MSKPSPARRAFRPPACRLRNGIWGGVLLLAGCAGGARQTAPSLLPPSLQTAASIEDGNSPKEETPNGHRTSYAEEIREAVRRGWYTEAREKLRRWKASASPSPEETDPLEKELEEAREILQEPPPASAAEWKTAFERLGRLKEISPQSRIPEIRLRQQGDSVCETIRLRIREGKYGEAQELLETVEPFLPGDERCASLRRHLENGRDLLTRGVERIQKEQWSAALDRFAELAVLSDRDPSLFERLKELQEKPASAGADAQASTPPPLADPLPAERVRDRLAEWEKAAAEGEWEKAVRACEAVLEEFPEHPVALELKQTAERTGPAQEESDRLFDRLNRTLSERKREEYLAFFPPDSELLRREESRIDPFFQEPLRITASRFEGVEVRPVDRDLLQVSCIWNVELLYRSDHPMKMRKQMEISLLRNNNGWNICDIRIP